MVSSLCLSSYYYDKSIREENKEFYFLEQPIRFLDHLKDINIVVGGNNTRKSRFFKMLMELESYPIWTVIQSLELLIRDLEGLCKELVNYKNIVVVEFKLYNVHHDNKEKIKKVIKRITSDEDYEIQVSLLIAQIEVLINNIQQCKSEQNLNEIKTIIENLIFSFDISLYFVKSLYSEDPLEKKQYPLNKLPYSTFKTKLPSDVAKRLKDAGISGVLSEIGKLLENLKEGISFELCNPSIVYIPILRTSKTLHGVSNDIFEETIKNQMPNLNPKVVIHTGLSLNNRILKSRNGTKEDFFDFLEFEKFIGSTFFDGEDINIIAQYDGKKEIKISLPGERPNVSFNDLGDGVSGIINLLYPIFTADDNGWVFIEEPENNLHPAFQNIFVKALAENVFLKKKNLKIFINTHSNHILVNSYLSPEDINVMVFSKRNQDTTSIISFNDNRKSTLDLLGVLNTSVLISNCLLWVEGITDRLYIKAFLRAYIDNLMDDKLIIREGLDYCFIEYGGSNIVHYDFNEIGENTITDDIEAFYTNNRILVLADYDNSEAKVSQFSNFRNNQFVYLNTKLPEIENIIPPDILRDFLKELGISDSQISKINFELVLTEKLGKVFSGVKKNSKRLVIEAKYGGTLAPSYKRKLAEFVYQKVVDGTYNWDVLKRSENIKRITIKIFKFIKKYK